MIARLLLFAFVFAGCGVLPTGHNYGKFGAWTLKTFTGDITYENKVCDVKVITYRPSMTSSWNRISIGSQGQLVWRLGFEAGAETYEIAGDGTAIDGVIEGNLVDTETGTTAKVNGTWDSTLMSVSWNFAQSTGVAGSCWTDVSGSGTFTATAP